jgi:alpha-ketoglutarate-dependent taurine dioxygenase
MNNYKGVTTRFLKNYERLILSEEKEMPLVIEAAELKSSQFLSDFLKSNATEIINDLAQYGAVLLRGFDVSSDNQFEKIILSIPHFRGIKEAFMAENGRVHVGDLKYVLHTNSVYKTGGTLYLGGFHTENYYSPDVPGYICFYCNDPAPLGGETGIINTEKIYRNLNSDLKEKLEKSTFFVEKWLVSEVASRYKIDAQTVEKICLHFGLPVVGEDNKRFILMYKPHVFEHPLTKEKSLEINLFELPTLNTELRKLFLNDYKGKEWFWHRLFWRLPTGLFHAIEFLAVVFIAFFNSPKKSFNIVRTKMATYLASKKGHSFSTTRVASCFTKQEIKQLARLMRDCYSSCIWRKGDILIIDNKKVAHAGMPGKGKRVIRAMICNRLDINYSLGGSGLVKAHDYASGVMGECMTLGAIESTSKGAHPKQSEVAQEGTTA